jgi:hypothetical protein
MTSVGAPVRHTGSRPAAGRPAVRIVVRLRGALDVTAAPALRERLIGLLHPGMSLLVLDLVAGPAAARRPEDGDHAGQALWSSAGDPGAQS